MGDEFKLRYVLAPASIPPSGEMLGVGQRVTIVARLSADALVACIESVAYNDRVLKLLDPGPTRDHGSGKITVESKWHFEAIGSGEAWIELTARADDVP